MSTLNIGFYEAIPMSTHNIGFYEEISKLIPYQITSNTHIISSAILMFLVHRQTL